MRVRSLVLAPLLATLLGVASARAFKPVDYSGNSPSIHLTLLGRYGGGTFSTRSVEGPPAYDPERALLYWIRQNKKRIDIVNIANPAVPQRKGTIGLSYAGYGAEGIAYNGKILVVAFTALNKSDRGTVLLLDRQGDIKGGPIFVQPQPTMVTFSPDGRSIYIPHRGEANDDYSVDPEGSLTVIDTCDRGACRNPRINSMSFRRFNDQKMQLQEQGVRLPIPNASVAQDLEPETVAISPDGYTAWVTLQRNNALAEFDLARQTVNRIISLGYKNHARRGFGLDASDRDGGINIRSWPVFAWYEPDFIAAIPIQGKLYLVTANEGDPRDFGDGHYSEVKRVSELTLDSAAFPDAAFLQQDRNLGRLQVSAVDGDDNGDGRLEHLYAFGGRSFGIWTPQGKLIFDSHGQFERVIARAIPRYFNASDEANSIDQRSVSRGPEPEPLDVGTIDGRQYAFIGLERIGGLFVYEITDPVHAHFVQYINNRNFAIDPAECVGTSAPPSECSEVGDLSVEGVLFIPEAQSPIPAPLVIATHETSDSLAIFRVDRVPLP